ncbi:dimethyl sulfoxide reductase anchor subunit family protein [Spiribacter halobius]|uniref:DMSO reductase n=1 Tax=Sediminicurvatus halobius TaxID=2182432 RepID=A0A2U2N639_9GAMM|nr:DmsC/YnfH family molybdoenzyme membrane anchor subunit [Spiribacter halobius]PWG64543.1 DMSO reductase [Spiribacter halobius]UEX79134.1 dimethyl sulfoxide reductase anchor subunit [Spiribacter halobius]
MHPALSVIFFTVVSGAGFGLVMLAALAALMPALLPVSEAERLVAGVLGTALATAGLMASTLHLANPKNAWRAFFRFRTSWLSREAVFSVLFYPFAVLWLGGVWWLGGPTALTTAAALAALVLAIATVFATGMIYASLRAIPNWHSPLVPMNYLLLSLASGALLMLAVQTVMRGGAVGQTLVTLTLALIAAAALGKAVYFYWIGAPAGSSINTATGMTRGQVRLLHTGQSSEQTFLDKEFRFQVAARRLRWLRLAVAALGFVLPLVLVASLLGGGSGWLVLLAVPVALAGLAIERWLFFAEARHVVNLFYGAQRV